MTFSSFFSHVGHTIFRHVVRYNAHDLSIFTCGSSPFQAFPFGIGIDPNPPVSNSGSPSDVTHPQKNPRFVVVHPTKPPSPHVQVGVWMRRYVARIRIVHHLVAMDVHTSAVDAWSIQSAHRKGCSASSDGTSTVQVQLLRCQGCGCTHGSTSLPPPLSRTVVGGGLGWGVHPSLDGWDTWSAPRHFAGTTTVHPRT